VTKLTYKHNVIAVTPHTFLVYNFIGHDLNLVVTRESRIVVERNVMNIWDFIYFLGVE